MLQIKRLETVILIDALKACNNESTHGGTVTLAYSPLEANSMGSLRILKSNASNSG